MILLRSFNPLIFHKTTASSTFKLLAAKSLSTYPSKSILQSPTNSVLIQHKKEASTFLAANKQWLTERLISAQLIILFPSIFIIPSPFLESLLVTLTVLHAHWGMEHIVVDYVPRKAVPVVKKSLFVFSGVALAGFLYYVFNDIGIAESFKRIWAI